MLRIVNVITDSNVGGAGLILLTFLRNYNRKKLDVSVILPRGSRLIDDLKKLAVPYTETDGLAERSFSFASIRSLARLLNDAKPDIVHTHASMSARVAARFVPGAKIVYTRHSVFPNKPALTKFPGKQVFGAVNNFFADKIIAVSPAAQDNIVETGVNVKKIEVIYNGVDPVKRLSPDEKRSLRSAYGLSESDFLCGIFARLTPVKGHTYVLDAAKQLLNNPRVKIFIAGAGETEDELKARAEKEHLTNVIFAGFVTNAPRMIAAMDVLLNASYGTEATSLTLLEGMSAGIPAVVTDFGGNPYVIKNGVNGFVIGQRDGQALANATLRLEEDAALYKRLSDGAIAAYQERFTAEAMTKSIENLYFSLYS